MTIYMQVNILTRRNRFKCHRLGCPSACKFPIRIITTPYRFIPCPLWPMLKHWRPDNLARGHVSLLHRDSQCVLLHRFARSPLSGNSDSTNPSLDYIPAHSYQWWCTLLDSTTIHHQPTCQPTAPTLETHRTHPANPPVNPPHPPHPPCQPTTPTTPTCQPTVHTLPTHHTHPVNPTLVVPML